MIKFFVKYFFYLLVLAPLLGYLLRGFYDFKIAVTTLFGFIAFLIVLGIVFTKGFVVKKPAYFLLGFLFALYYAVWGFFNGVSEEFGIAKFFLANNYVFVLFVLIVIENTHFSDKFIKNIIFLFKITIIASFAVSLIQALVDPKFFTPKLIQEFNENFNEISQYEIRNQSIFGYLDQNDIGLSFIPILALFVGFHFLKKNKINILFFAYVIMAGLVCVLTNGRYVMLNFIIIFSQIFFLKYMSFYKKISYFILTFLIMGIIIVGLTYLGYDLNKFYEERIMSESANSRIIAFDMFEEFFGDNPVFGTGVRTTDQLESALYGRSSQIHVGYLSALFEWGFVGAFLLFLFWFKIAKDLYKKAKKSYFYGAFIGFITFLIANTVLVQYSIFFYGLIFCFVFSKHYYNNAGYENESDLICV